MLAPSMRIRLVRIAVGITALFLLIAALGISTDFWFLKLVITIGFVVIAGLSFLMNYRDLGIASILLAALFNPFIPIVLPRHIWVIIDIVAFIGIIYYAFWTTNSYWKGSRFEEYVSTLFPEPDFVLVDQTRDSGKRFGRKVESDGHPDLIFRSKKTGKKFAVECKWRGRWAYQVNGGRGIWWNLYQTDKYERYKKESGILVYVAFGIGGSPERPQEVYFLEVERLHHPFLYRSLIKSGKTPLSLKNEIS